MIDEPDVHPKNRLNDLTGREWLYFLNSVDTSPYPTTGPDSCGHDLRRAHPSPKPPELMRRFVEFFTKRGGWVLDPFAGVGGTLLGAAMCGRNAVGIDLDPRYLDIYHAVSGREGLPVQATIRADARDLASLPEVTAHRYDLVLTDPPYAGMMARPQSGEKKKRTGSDEATPFTDLPHDLGNLPYADFLCELRAIIGSALPFLNARGHIVLFTKDLQPTPANPNLLHADIVREMLTLPSLAYRGMKIWVDRAPRLYPFGYPHAFVANQLHQYALIFRKER